MARMLIVDDEPGFAPLIGQALANRGHDVRATDNAAEAIRQAALLIPEVLVLDWMLGKGSDRDTVLAAAQQAAPNVAVVVITGLRADQVSLSIAGTWEALEKPFSVDDLSDAVNRVLTP